mmetsp:Transcript_32402/g.75269  ORF Transcript_32402/g.75269 Transcript_32402/m.75269 type:complete len:155 (+) Transcript_32402:275-739(+)
MPALLFAATGSAPVAERLSANLLAVRGHAIDASPDWASRVVPGGGQEALVSFGRYCSLDELHSRPHLSRFCDLAPVNNRWTNVEDVGRCGAGDQPTLCCSSGGRLGSLRLSTGTRTMWCGPSLGLQCGWRADPRLIGGQAAEAEVSQVPGDDGA